MTTQVESPVSTGPSDLLCERNEAAYTVTFTAPRGVRLPRKLSKAARHSGLVRFSVVRGRQLTCELRPRSTMLFDEIADKVEETVNSKYMRSQQAVKPESNTERRRKERLLKQPALAKS